MKVSQLPVVMEPLGEGKFKRVAVLQNVYNYFVQMEIEKLPVYEFELLAGDQKASFINHYNYIEINGQIFNITSIKHTRGKRKPRHITVSGTHICYDLCYYYREQDSIVENYKPSASLTETMNELLQNTPYTFIGTDITTRIDIMLERGSILKNIYKCIKTFGGELVVDNFNISIVTTYGRDNGILIRHEKNAKTVQKALNTYDVTTRLYVYGKDGLTIESVNDGKKYIDSSHINDYPWPINNHVTYNNITDPNLLLEKGKERLKKDENPKVVYTASVVDLTKNDPTNTEKFTLGDMVHVVDKELGIKIKSRVVAYIEFMIPAESHKSIIEVNSRSEDIRKYHSEWVRNGRTINRVLNEQTKNLSTNYLDGAINTLKNQLTASGAYATAEVLEDKGYLLENTNVSSPDYGAMYIGPGIFAIASNKVGGKWNWRTFGTGKGFVADEIRTGTLNADLVNVINLSASNIETGTLNAIDITGSTITGSELTAKNSSSDMRVEIDPSSDSVFTIKYLNKPVFRIEGKDLYIGSEINFDNTNAFNEMDISTAGNEAYVRNNSNYLTIHSNGNNLEFGSSSNDDMTLFAGNNDFNIWTGSGKMNYNDHEVATVNSTVQKEGLNNIQVRYDSGNFEIKYDGGEWKTIVVTE